MPSRCPSRRELANAIRALSMDAVQKANSGHPGAPMGMADIAEVLWNSYLKHNPANPAWADRDRFVLSNGHGSMLIYSLLHLTGYDLPLEELKNFRQLHSKTPGHPEYGYAPGVETTTGPLGQGITNAVGMALAEKVLAAQFNRDGHTIVDHHTYTFLGDGCLMEGISHEACSLAGTLGLGKLIAFYDDNGISIDGEVAGGHGAPGWFTDDTVQRFNAYHWQVIGPIDGHDAAAIQAAIETAKTETKKPTLIICKTIIGFGSPNKQGKEDCHGAPLGADEIALAREQLNWPYAPFEIPANIRAGWDAKAAGAARETEWNNRFAAYAAAHPELAKEFQRRIAGELPADFSAQADAYIAACQEKGETIASRKASQNTLNAFGPLLPEFLGGSADLAGSNLTLWKGCKGVSAEDASGNYMYYGVREFGMSAMMNGIALHGGFVPYGATFLMFMEYARNAVRMAALMKQRVLFVYTHDSIGLGEDGPTHQPVEQLSALACHAKPAYLAPLRYSGISSELEIGYRIQTRPERFDFLAPEFAAPASHCAASSDIAKGGYILKDSVGVPKLILIATGSEVGLAMEAAQQLSLGELGDGVRVVSMPCAELFSAQNAAYREAVLPSAVRARLAIEAAHPDYWHKFVGLDGAVIGVHRFGESAPAGALFKEYGFTVEHVVAVAKKLY
jgi:transketolase